LRDRKLRRTLLLATRIAHRFLSILTTYIEFIIYFIIYCSKHNKKTIDSTYEQDNKVGLLEDSAGHERTECISEHIIHIILFNFHS